MPLAAAFVIGGVMAMCWILASSGILVQVSQSLAAALPNIPGVTWQGIFGGIGSWFHGLGTWVNAHITPFWQGIWAHHDSHLQGLNATDRLAGSTFGAMARVKTQIIPHAVGVEGAARTTADDNLWKSTVGLAEQTQAKAQALVDGESTQRQLQDARLEQLLNIDVQGAKDQASAQISAEANTRTLSDDALGRSISAQGDQLTQLINSGLNATAAAAAVQLAQEIARATGAEGTLEQELTQIRKLDCMKFCNILGGIGSLLSGLELAGLLALLAEAYANPEGAVQLLNQDLVKPTEQALGDVLGLFGIKAA